jgi:2-polyprenyl-3-methyl-5-hydroxy-6-metoxy-1,4-benzoquinol methylase
MALICSGYLKCNPQNFTSYSIDGDLEFLRCSDCGLIWRSPASLPVTRVYSSEYFDSKNYLRNRDHKIKKSGWLVDIALSQNREIQNMLEIGCSVGNTLEAATLRNIENTGIDISGYAVQYCRDKGLQAECKTPEDLLAEGRKFDLIFMQHVLEHFVNPFEVLSTCRKLLNDNGLLLLMVPNSRFNPAVRNRGKHRFYRLTGVGAEHFAYFDYPSLRKVLESQNFQVLQLNYPFKVKGPFSLEFFLNRVFRRGLSLFNADQELLVVAGKL